MITSINFSQTQSPPKQKQQTRQPRYLLKWRQGQLLVKPSQQARQICSHPVEDKQWLVDCLKHSPVRLVCLDRELGETELQMWADASEQAHKKVFLRIPFNRDLFRRNPLWVLKRIVDWVTANLLLLALTPVMLGLVLLMRVYMPGPIFSRQWHVGQRGKLFQTIKFRTIGVDAEKLHYQLMVDQSGLRKKDELQTTPLGQWMRKYSLDELPQLLNVVRGEMSLVGPRPQALYDALRLGPEGQGGLTLPRVVRS